MLSTDWISKWIQVVCSTYLMGVHSKSRIIQIVFKMFRRRPDLTKLHDYIWLSYYTHIFTRHLTDIFCLVYVDFYMKHAFTLICFGIIHTFVLTHATKPILISAAGIHQKQNHLFEEKSEDSIAKVRCFI